MAVASRRRCSRRRNQVVFAEAIQADGSFALEVRPGTWHVVVESERCPRMSAGSHELAQGARWDVGTLRLAHGGRVVLRERGDLPANYLILDANERIVVGLYTPEPPLRSELLTPGDHLLVVRGKGVAAHAVPFTIRAGHELELEVTKTAGIGQVVEFVPAATGRATTESVWFDVRRDGRLVTCDCSRPDGAKAGAAQTARIWLAPGRYTLRTRDRDPVTEVAFTVGATEGPPLRVDVR